MIDTNSEKFALDFVSNEKNFYLLDNENLEPIDSGPISIDDFNIYKIMELTFEDESPRKEAFENVISSMRIDAVSLIYIIEGNKKGVSFYFGVSRNLNEEKKDHPSIFDIGEEILAPSLKGNFRGSEIQEVESANKKKLIEKIKKKKYFACLEGVPGINEDREDFQGVERLSDVMMGDDFMVVVIADPLTLSEIHYLEKSIFNTYDRIVPMSGYSIQEGLYETTTESNTKRTGTSTGERVNKTKTSAKTDTGTQTDIKGTNTSKTKEKRSNPSSDKTETSTETGHEENKNDKVHQESDTTQNSKTDESSKNESEEKVVSTNKGNNGSTSIEFVKKSASEWLKYLDEVILPRLDYGKSKGVLVTTTLLATDGKTELLKLAGNMQSLFSGKEGNKVPLKLHFLDERNPNENLIKKSLINLQIPKAKIKITNTNELEARATMCQFIDNGVVRIGNWISTNELALIAGLPKREVIGLKLREEVEFGLNISNEGDSKSMIELGHLVQSGRVLQNISFHIEKENLNTHTFITGVTGSGKTTTCQKLLIKSELPFLVIEPAKTEYRVLFDAFDDVLIFTLGNNNIAPFKLNPFEFYPNESITSRVDMLMASFKSAFDMEAAIPQILEAAIYKCYLDYGWNIASNRNKLYEDPWADGVFAFPTLENLYNKIEETLDQQKFGADGRLKGDYLGSIQARLQGLLVGSKGLMLNVYRSVNLKSLLDKRVIFEIEDIKSGDEKSLIMGFILTDLVEALKDKHREKPDFRHITLIEEAHRLLSRYMPGDSSNKKLGVEIFTDMLAEVRKYGESLIIVDQIPNKLTPEVLKNTNTKIVHKLFANDDKEAIGSTMAMSDEQRNFLSYLEIGRAIVFTHGLNKPVQIQVKRETDTTSLQQISSEVLHDRIVKFYKENYKKGMLLGLESMEHEPSLDEVENYLHFLQETELETNYKKFINEYERTDYLKKSVIENFENLKINTGLMSTYLARKYYRRSVERENKDIDILIKQLLEDVIKGESNEVLNKYNRKLKIND